MKCGEPVCEIVKGEFRFQGHATPGGENGTVEIVEIVGKKGGRKSAEGCPDLWRAIELAHSVGAESNIDFVRIVDEIFPGYVLT